MAGEGPSGGEQGKERGTAEVQQGSGGWGGLGEKVQRKG
jgi:hypothetical protein